MTPDVDASGPAGHPSALFFLDERESHQLSLDGVSPAIALGGRRPTLAETFAEVLEEISNRPDARQFTARLSPSSRERVTYLASSIAVDGDPPREFPDEPYEYNSSNVFTADLLLSALWQDAVVSSDAARAMETMVSRAIIGRDIAQFAGVDMRSLDLLFLSPAIMARTDALSLIRQDARTVREMAELLRRIAKTLRSFPLLVQTEREFLSRASAEVAAHLSERQIHTLETECAQRLAALSELEEASGGAPTLESLATALSSVPVSEPTSMIAIDLPQEYAERLRQAELCDVLAELLRADQNLNEVKPASGESSTIGTLAVSFDSLRSSYLVLPLGREGTRSASGPFEVLCVE